MATHQREQETVLCLQRLTFCSTFAGAVPSNVHGTEAYNYHAVPFGTELQLLNGKSVTVLLAEDLPGDTPEQKQQLYDTAVSMPARQHMLRELIHAALPGYMLRKRNSRLVAQRGRIQETNTLGAWSAQVIRTFLNDAGFHALLKDPVMQACLHESESIPIPIPMDMDIEEEDEEEEEEEEEVEQKQQMELSPLVVPETTVHPALSLSQLQAVESSLPLQPVHIATPVDVDASLPVAAADNVEVVSAVTPRRASPVSSPAENFNTLTFLNGNSPPESSQQQQQQQQQQSQTITLTPFELPLLPPSSQEQREEEEVENSPPRDMRLGTFLPKEVNDLSDDDDTGTVFVASPRRSSIEQQQQQPNVIHDDDDNNEEVVVPVLQPPATAPASLTPEFGFSGPFAVFGNDTTQAWQNWQTGNQESVHDRAALTAVAYVLLNTYPPYVPLSAKGGFKRSDLYTLIKTTQQKHAQPIAASIKTFVKNYALGEPFSNDNDHAFVVQLTHLAHILCPRTNTPSESTVEYIIERLKAVLIDVATGEDAVVFKGLLNTALPELPLLGQQQQHNHYLFIYRADEIYTLVCFSARSQTLQLDHRVQYHAEIIKRAISQVLSLETDIELQVDAVPFSSLPDASSWLVACFGVLSYMFWSDLHWYGGVVNDDGDTSSTDTTSANNKSRARVPEGCSVVSVEPQAYWDNSLLCIFPAVLFIWLMQDPPPNDHSLRRQIKAFKRSQLAANNDDQKRAYKDPFHPSMLVVEQGDILTKQQLVSGASHNFEDANLETQLLLLRQITGASVIDRGTEYPVFVARVPREETYTELVHFLVPWLFRVGLMLRDTDSAQTDVLQQQLRSAIGFVAENSYGDDYSHNKSEIRFLLEFVALWKLARNTKYQKQRFMQLYSLVSRTFVSYS